MNQLSRRIRRMKSCDYWMIAYRKIENNETLLGKNDKGEEKNDKAILEDIAKENDRSVNYVINQAIKEFIKKSSFNNQKPELQK